MDRPNRKATTTVASKRQRSADELLSEIENKMGESWLAAIYRDRILKLRTRSYLFPSPAKQRGKQTTPEIQHTLLGIELKVGRQRMLCPDLATARYLAVFARAGCEAVAIPYDITRISHLADELESSWHRMLLLTDRLAGDRGEAFATRVRGLLIGKVRDEIAAAGAGTRIPEFNQSTRERERPQKSAKGNE
ncbi:MAG TPA: hypothetical protein VK582_26325 [Pyrinomonadaceae bacterium]|nr:hypothetical protein [Pyrinomonadaceae bacterium]